MERYNAGFGSLSPAAGHFRKITGHYWKNLFFCYDVADLPRTNNDLEQAFGAFRHAQRRATGRKSASRSEVLQGPASIVVSLAARLRPFTAADLSRANIGGWQELRATIRKRRQLRNAGRRFRRAPEQFLDDLTQRTLQLLLPS